MRTLMLAAIAAYKRDTERSERELARAGIAGPAFYLLRPDGHVGLAGTRVDVEVIRRYLAQRSIRAQPGR